MAKSIKFSSGEYQVLPIIQVVENSWNPNKMNEKDFLKLKEILDKSGGNFEQPILVRPVNAGYEIVDGCHRWKALSELGFEDIYVRVEELSDKDAIIRTIQMNRFRGDFDTMKLATLIRDLKDTYDMTNSSLKEALWYDPEEIYSLESFLDFNADDFIKVKEEKVQDADDIIDIENSSGVMIELSKAENEELQSFIARTGLTQEQAVYAALIMLKEERLKQV